MSDTRVLSQTQLAYVREVIERERSFLIPSPLQGVWFRVFNKVALAFLVLLVISGAVYGIAFLKTGDAKGGEPLAVLGCCGVAVLVLLAILLVPLFLLNLPLALKFWRLARLRRRLGLARGLSRAFRERRKRHRVQNLLTGLGVILGIAMLALAIVFFDEIGLKQYASKTDSRFDAVVLVAAALLVPLGVASLHYLRRGRERLEVLTELLDSLAEEAAGEPGAEGVAISADSYRQVAQLEREGILLDRQRSIREGARGGAERYVLQKSLEVQAALDGLTDPAARVLIEKTIYSLVRDPTPTEARADTETGLYRLPVAQAAHELAYEVEASTRRIRVLTLAPTAADASGPGSEEER